VSPRSLGLIGDGTLVAELIGLLHVAELLQRNHSREGRVLLGASQAAEQPFPPPSLSDCGQARPQVLTG
jgi:hypothetical protein